MKSKSEKIEKLTKQDLFTGFRVMFSYLASYKKTLIILSVIGVLSAIGNGIVPFIIGKFFDSIIESSSISILGFILPLFVVFLSIWAIIQLVTYLLDWRLGLMSEYLSIYVWSDYITQGFGFLLTLPISFHKKNKIGEIGNKINQAAQALDIISGQVIIDLAPKILSIIIAIVVAFYIKPFLAFILIIGLVIYLFALYIKLKPLGGLQKQYHNRISETFGSAYDALLNTTAVKQSGTEIYEQEKIDVNMKGIVSSWVSINKIWGSLTLFQRFTILITQIVIFLVSIIFINQGTMTLGELLAFNAYAALVFGPFTIIVRNWQFIHSGVVSVLEMEKILGLESENYHVNDENSFELNGNIEFKNVSFMYERGKQVLTDISFSVKAGEVVALVGESGVGKSTLVDLISAYHYPKTGNVIIDGHDIKNISLKSLRNQIAVVPQEVALFNETVKTNIKYGNFKAKNDEILEAAKKAHAVDFIEKLPKKWEQVVGERGVKLSVGQKQRIAIARAILRNPKILILDEPTSALDAGSEKIITDSLEELMKGKTTFIIAHRLSTVRKANKILVFKQGKIVESGSHFELLKIEGGEYKRLYELQIGLHQ